MSSLSLPEMLGKTCLPCLPRDVGEDIWGCWGRHSEMLGKTGTLGKRLKFVGEDIKEDGVDIGEVRDDGDDLGDDGDDMPSLSSLGGRGRRSSGIFLEMSGTSCLPCLHLRCRGRHVFPVFLEMLGKSCLPCLRLRCRGRHVFPVFLEMLGKACLPYLP